jgi:hypothetical protein
MSELSSRSGVICVPIYWNKGESEMKLLLSPTAALSSVADGSVGVLRGGMSKASVFEHTPFGFLVPRLVPLRPHSR